MDRFVANVRNFFSPPVREQDVEMGKLGNSQRAARTGAAPEPRACFSFGNWLKIPSFQFRLPECLTPSLPRALVQWRATAAFKDALEHIKDASPLKSGPEDYTKAAKAFRRFHALIAEAPNGEQLLEQIAKDGFAGRKLLERATLLSHLKPDGGFYQALVKSEHGASGSADALRRFCDNVAHASEAALNSARKFKG